MPKHPILWHNNYCLTTWVLPVYRARFDVLPKPNAQSMIVLSGMKIIFRKIKNTLRIVKARIKLVFTSLGIYDLNFSQFLPIL